MIGVYGANGFIGRHLVDSLVASGQAVRAVSRRFDDEFVANRSNFVDFVRADILQPIAIGPSLEGVDTVVQLISSSSPALGNRYSVEDIRDNVIPHIEFLQAVAASGVRRFIFVSSGGTVYGPDAPIPTPEDAPTRPINSHGLTKLTIEQYIHMHAHVDGLDFVILRLANCYGPGQFYKKAQGLIPAIIGHYEQRTPVRIIGDGSSERDYVYVDDVVRAIILAARCESASRQIINIGSGRSTAVLDVLHIVEAALGQTMTKEFAPSRATDVGVSLLSIAKAQNLLSWEPEIPLAEGIARTISALRARSHGASH